MKPIKAQPKITLVGHPFSPHGTGRALRLSLAACESAGIEVRVRDVWKQNPPEPSHQAITPLLTDTYGDINLFHVNGDEVIRTLDHLGPANGHFNVIFPFWELPRYPDIWARQLEKFDEVWAASNYIKDMLGRSVNRPIKHMPLATEIDLASFYDRKYFGIPENSYTFLFFFDCRSFIARKNPQAAVAAFRQLIAARPWVTTHLVIKMHGAEAARSEAQALFESVADLRERILILPERMQECEVHNLIRCCDSFVSLHRAEGYGLGLAEAMFLGLPSIGTGYSGNMDFMTSVNSVPVGFSLIDVPPEAYPHWEHQEWAEPNIAEAASRMIDLLDNPKKGRELGSNASRDMRVNFSYRATGQRYRARLEEIQSAHAYVPISLEC
ncbi:glycosyltransferase family 4 protein [Variovorax sp. J2P1-59]|uniref:glycosyltransferase family 4 protein n=1 Tax=Variovorax flavidus TaxID=3053501 RepID=UPI00257710B1|nr:glycosyltransferase family 4 protein [Variovorax sp. J2P1-59]MDM0077388.1 glycosyltransferase family 4 protein [Variovorax sp. J2P1-59]